MTTFATTRGGHTWNIERHPRLEMSTIFFPFLPRQAKVSKNIIRAIHNNTYFHNLRLSWHHTTHFTKTNEFFVFNGFILNATNILNLNIRNLNTTIPFRAFSIQIHNYQGNHWSRIRININCPHISSPRIFNSARIQPHPSLTFRLP